MPQLTIEVPHALGQAEAVRRLQEQFSVAQEAYQSHISDLHQEWTDGTLTFGFRAVGLNVSGTMVVEEAAVKLDAHLPLAAVIFRGVIEQQVRAELQRILA